MYRVGVVGQKRTFILEVQPETLFVLVGPLTNLVQCALKLNCTFQNLKFYKQCINERRFLPYFIIFIYFIFLFSTCI